MVQEASGHHFHQCRWRRGPLAHTRGIDQPISGMVPVTISQSMQLRTPKAFANNWSYVSISALTWRSESPLPFSIISYAMLPTLDALSRDALVLPPDQRVALAYRLLVSVEPGPEPGAEAAWDAEITQRIARFDSGEA